MTLLLSIRSLYSTWYNFMIEIATRGRFSNEQILLAVTHTHPTHHVCRPNLHFSEFQNSTAKILTLNRLKSNSLSFQLWPWGVVSSPYIASHHHLPTRLQISLYFYFSSVKLYDATKCVLFPFGFQEQDDWCYFINLRSA